MSSRRKVRIVQCPDAMKGLLATCLDRTEVLTARQRHAVRKDALLLHCAWATDELVSSLDDTMRKFLARLAPECPEIGSVVWVNPARHEEGALAWLKAGARGRRSAGSGAGACEWGRCQAGQKLVRHEPGPG